MFPILKRQKKKKTFLQRPTPAKTPGLCSVAKIPSVHTHLTIHEHIITASRPTYSSYFDVVHSVKCDVSNYKINNLHTKYKRLLVL